MTDQHIHLSQPLLSAGTALSDAHAAVILMHGRGSTARQILTLADYLPQDGVAYLAPQAANQTWYPHSGFGPLETNQPYISSAFQTMTDLLAQVSAAGIPVDRVVWGGFSQGACLAAEYVARHPQRYGGLFVLSGALLGPPDMPRAYDGSLAGTPVYVGGANRDPWVTEPQLRLTASALQDLGGSVQIEVQASPEHTVRETDIAHMQAMIAALLPA